MPPRRRSPPSAAQQGGLFCRSCGAPLAGDDELRQGECNACYDLFAEPPPLAAPAPPADLPDDLALAWLQVERPPGAYPDLTEHAGVWIVAVGLGSFEQAWAAIRAATEAGLLGPRAQVVPAARERLPKAWTGPQLVIEVTTYDATDEADVWRVRQAIRDLGISAALTYLGDQRPDSAPAQPAARMRTRSLFD
jgi:Bles03-like protein